MLGKLARQHDPNVLVGFDTADDAGVYQLTPEQALVQTVAHDIRATIQENLWDMLGKRRSVWFG